MHERLTDLREILRYVPRFRDRVFVIAIDGAVVEDDNFPNLLLDIALLRSLSIRVALVHGAAHQIRRYAELMKVTPSDVDGTGITDRDTLQVAITAANRVTHEILEGLSANDLRGGLPERRRRAPGRHPRRRRSPVHRARSSASTPDCSRRCWNTTSSRSFRRSAATAPATRSA